jgi:hypothetical protein
VLRSFGLRVRRGASRTPEKRADAPVLDLNVAPDFRPGFFCCAPAWVISPACTVNVYFYRISDYLVVRTFGARFHISFLANQEALWTGGVFFAIWQSQQRE